MITPEQLQKLTQLKDIVLTATEAKRYVDGINAALSQRIKALSDALNALVGAEDTTAAIDTFNEVIAFLNGIEGTTLDALLSALRQSVNTLDQSKQDVIADLTTIRSGAAAGATAYQKPGTGIPKSDMTSGVQSSLEKADSAYQKPSTGIPSKDMSASVKQSLGYADTAYQKPGTGIPKTDMTASVQQSLSAADTAYQKPQSGIPATDLTATIQQLLTAAGTALQPADIVTLTEKVAALEALVASDADGVIDKFNEIVAFLAGIGSNDTLAGILADIATQLNAKYVKPSGGIPKSDMTATVQASLEAADTALQFEPDTDPTDAETVDELARVLAVLYQAITDAQTATAATQTATTHANTATGDANDAADNANAAATLATEKAGVAQTAANNANAAMNAAKGSYTTLAARLAAMDETDAEKYVKPTTGIPSSDLASAVQALLTAAGTALQPADLTTLNNKVAALESLIAEDADGIIDKFNEIVDFLAGITDAQTLAGIIGGINDAIAAKYTKPSGGIPSTDMTEAVQTSLAKANAAAPQSTTYSKTEVDTKLEEKLEFEATEDPTDADLVDEYARVLAALYQALTDAQNAKADYIGDDNYVYRWNPLTGQYEKTNLCAKGDPGTTDYTQLQNKPTIPSALSDLTEDSGHRTVSDTEKATWSGKQDAISDLNAIRTGAAAGAEAMQFEANSDPASLFEEDSSSSE